MRTFGRGIWCVGAFAAFALAASMPAMATTITMTIEGATQGAIGQRIRVQSVTHDAFASQNAIGGRRQHGVITVVKQIDATSPQLFKASSSGEILREVVITFEGGAGGGKAAERIELRNALISGIRRAGTSEFITMNYEAVTVTYVGGEKSATDDWTAQR